jgi:outer membrane protein OmpA-like peptidoglycan-associated protein
MKQKIIAFMLLWMTSSSFSQEKIEVYFDFNKDIPNLSSADVFNKWMNENPNVEVVKISGFCDSIDNSSYNKDLAMRRINSILQNLKGSKIKINSNVVLDNNGKDLKQAKNQAENRKVIVFYNKPQKPVSQVQEVKKVIVPEVKKVVPEIKEVKLSEAVKTSKVGDLIKLPNFYFYNNSDKIVSKSEPTLKELLDIMNENPKLKIEIQGHICCKKPDQPDEISEARAKMVYQYLKQNKIDRKRLSYKGYGVSRPIHPIPEKNVAEEDENRRVEIRIVEN